MAASLLTCSDVTANKEVNQSLDALLAATPQVDGVRKAMNEYWKSYQPTVESMMLDENARALHQAESVEILSYVPDYDGKVVLELGAGIGRFTGVLAKKASHVTAVDFIKEFIDQNKVSNGSSGHVEFMHADVTELELPAAKYDIVFTNWLLMYLCDEEVYSVIQKILRWLKRDGYLFVRESCFHPSGKGVARPSTNPTFYRPPAWYSDILQNATTLTETAARERSSLVLHKANPVKAYIKYKQNPYQLCFLLQKVTRTVAQDESQESTTYDSFQAFLDKNQYTKSSILRYEKIFGPTYISTGGKKTTKEFCELLKFTDNPTVLDIGCGIGGSAFYMAKTYGAFVHGVDLSSNMISIALERQCEDVSTHEKVWFEISDTTKQSYPPESYNIVYSRDTILHIGDKEQLLRKVLTWLKPGGQLLITDYCRGDQEHSQQFLEYVAQRGYHLLTVKEYGELLESVGFVKVKAEDRTTQFIEILQNELDAFDKIKPEFLTDFSQVDYDYIVNGWKSKMERCKAGDQAWGLFIAKKAD